MAKQGILHDYDLMANAEPAAKKENVCIVCGSSPVTYQWADCSGEAMCVKCGTPYQIKWGSEEQETEGKYPYLNLKPEWVPIVQEYFKETHSFTCLGRMMSASPGMGAFVEWVKTKHPEMINE